LEANELHEKFSAAVKELQDVVGIPEEVFEELERAQLPPLEQRYWHNEVLAVSPTGDLDAHATAGLEALRALVDTSWLKQEAQEPYRLDDAFRESPLHFVSGIRLAPAVSRPQRFAQMLLVSTDHLNKHAGLDFFEAPMLISEVAALGNRLDEVRALGPEATKKLQRLPLMTDDEVASTVYELLVGTASVRMGLDVEMVGTHGSRKTPDFRVHNMRVPTSVECKRRLGLSKYELEEAAYVQRFYEALRQELRRRHASVEVRFRAEVSTIPIAEFCSAVVPQLDGTLDRREVTMPWGEIAVEVLPYTKEISRTRLFAPDFLSAAFGWMVDDLRWDGISCEVDAPDTLLVHRVRNPRCLKWVSCSETATMKKSRGVTTLWARATQQIPAGDFGCIYIAYPEGNRSDVADARTHEVMEASKRWTHRWSVNIGLTIVNRLYPRAMGVGAPDLIESALPLTSDGDSFLLGILPMCVFVPPPPRQAPPRRIAIR
jgi:hypothetical protein